MPNNRNAAKAMRQANKRRLRNRAARTSIRTVIKKVQDAVTGSDEAAVNSALKTATKKLDQAAANKFIHRNKAARLKSRLSALAKKKAAAKPPTADQAKN
jgi:small subunit ribosomal protein S20